MSDNSHAERKIAKRARMQLRPVFSSSDAITAAEQRREHRVLTLEPGDFVAVRATRFDEGEREPE